MKILFAGTPEFAVSALEALIKSEHEIVAVYTQPDRPAGRGRKLTPSPVKKCALLHGIDVVQPVNFKHQDDVDILRLYAADLMVVAAYGIILPNNVLKTPRLGCVNIHASLLPRWRGAAPIQRAILAGDKYSGITLMQMDAGLDTGNMLAKSKIKIHEGMTTLELHDELKDMGADLLLDSLESLKTQSIQSEKQDESEACYAIKLDKKEALIDWTKNAREISREVCAFNPWPVSYTMLSGDNTKIWVAEYKNKECEQHLGQVISHTRSGIEVCCGEGVLVIKELQFSGKQRRPADQVLNARCLEGEVFGE